MVRALASHQYSLDSNPGVDAICWLSLLLILSFAPRRFLPGTAGLPSVSKTNISKIPIPILGIVDEEPLRGCVTEESLLLYFL